MKTCCLTLALILAVITPVFAETDAPAVNTDTILKELEKIKDSRQTAIKGQLGKIIQTVNAAAANPSAALDLYLQAAFATRFDGENHEKTQFSDWKKKQSDTLKSKTFQEALRFYLIYLSLTLQSTAGVKNSDMVPSLTNYTLQVLTENDWDVDSDDLMRKPLADSLIVRGFGVTLTPAEGWVTVPGNIDDMYMKVILPELRLKKDAAAVEYWNRKIAMESDSASKAKRNYDADRFARIRKPTLLWSRAKEIFLIGQKNRGINEMLAVIKAFPIHPDAEDWANQLEQCIGKK